MTSSALPEALWQSTHVASFGCAGIDCVSLEDAHRYNDLRLLESFRDTRIILGAVQIASTRVESVDEIAARLEQALRHISASRLLVGPDCGLAMLPRELVFDKLRNMCAAARQVGPPDAGRRAPDQERFFHSGSKPHHSESFSQAAVKPDSENSA